MSDISTDSPTQNWTKVIEPRGKFIHFSISEFWNYRDLLSIFIHRNIVTVYKQTLLGWLWFIINPLISTALYLFVFGGLANLSTDGLPQTIFYMSGVVLWSYFTSCFSATSNFLAGNANLFSKSYFPRLILPVSGIVSSLITFLVQAILLLVIYIYFVWGGVSIRPTPELCALPLYVLLLAGTAFSWGLICSSLTIKYRDLESFIRVGMNLMMYITPVVYPVSLTRTRRFGWILDANPLSGIFESFRYSITGLGTMDWQGIGYCLICLITTLFIGLIMFTQAERNFIDTV